MQISPRLIGPLTALITGLFTSISMSFIGLSINYGFHPDFLPRWLKLAALNYTLIVPVLMLIVPQIQRFLMRQAGVGI